MTTLVRNSHPQVARMVSKEPLSTSHASYIRERLLAGYVNIWEDILACLGFNDWAYNNHFSKLYIHGAPQCGKVRWHFPARCTFRSRHEDNILSCCRRQALVCR
jgi:hypothetical protein